MSADLLTLLIRTVLAPSVAIVLLLLLRRPLRAAFGAQIAYAFWLLVPIATIAAMLPARQVFVTAPISENAAESMAAVQTAAQQAPEAGTAIEIAAISRQDLLPIILFVWLVGVFFSLLLIWREQRRFLLAATTAGPAVVGVFRPRIVLPADFDQRYSPAERELVIAHERAHIAAGDTVVNALASLALCLNWFNPLFHIARRALRVDQELACDARVMARHASAKRVYAEAMLKAQFDAQPVPLGCQWPPIGAQPLKERIIMLARPRPNALRVVLGATLCAAATLAGGTLAWATQEPRFVHISQERETSTTGDRALGRRLVEALQEGQMSEARELVEAGADVNYHLEGDGTPLVITARYGSRDMTEYLIARGADVNKPAPGDGNPLIMAAMAGHVDVARLLVEHGADVNGVVNGDETPLINAARSDRLEVARYLIANGADVNLSVMVPTVDGAERRSPLSEARRRGHPQMTALLREHGARS